MCDGSHTVVTSQLQKVDKDQKPPGGSQRNDNLE